MKLLDRILGGKDPVSGLRYRTKRKMLIARISKASASERAELVAELDALDAGRSAPSAPAANPTSPAPQAGSAPAPMPKLPSNPMADDIGQYLVSLIDPSAMDLSSPETASASLRKIELMRDIVGAVRAVDPDGKMLERLDSTNNREREDAARQVEAIIRTAEAKTTATSAAPISPATTTAAQEPQGLRGIARVEAAIRSQIGLKPNSRH